MSNGNRFMGHNRVTHRAIGEIPNCAPAFDIFVAIPLEEMRAATAVRAEKFCSLITDWMNGKIGHREFTAHPFHSGDTNLSVIRNPSKSYNRDF